MGVRLALRAFGCSVAVVALPACAESGLDAAPPQAPVQLAPPPVAQAPLPYVPPRGPVPPAPLGPPSQAPQASQPGNAVVAYAAAQVGRPYCWGGTGPGCFDCSGLALRAWQQVGVALPRSADDVPKVFPSVPLAEVRPGDLLWWPGHVAIYAGDGWSVEALNRQSGVVMRRAPRPRLALRPRA